MYNTNVNKATAGRLGIFNKKPGFTQHQLNPAAGGLVPQFAGQKQGLTFEQAQDFTNDQWKVKGFTIQANTGSTPVNINISGTAKELIGISLHAITNFANDALAPQAVNLIINNETFIQDMPFTLLDVKYMQNIFYPFKRVLFGNDQIILEIVNPLGVQTVGAAFYYR